MDLKEYSKEIVESVDILVKNAKEALKEYELLTQEDVNRISKAMAAVAMDHRVELAKMAVEETGRGIFEDKIIKNMFAAEYVWNSIKDIKTVGIISKNENEGYTEIAKPLGIIAGVTPVTNPTSTAIFKSIICAKQETRLYLHFTPVLKNAP